MVLENPNNLWPCYWPFDLNSMLHHCTSWPQFSDARPMPKNWFPTVPQRHNWVMLGVCWYWLSYWLTVAPHGHQRRHPTSFSGWEPEPIQPCSYRSVRWRLGTRDNVVSLRLQKSSLVGGAITILKNMSSSMGRMTSHIFIIYEMENKSHAPNHQPENLLETPIWPSLWETVLMKVGKCFDRTPGGQLGWKWWNLPVSPHSGQDQGQLFMLSSYLCHPLVSWLIQQPPFKC